MTVRPLILFAPLWVACDTFGPEPPPAPEPPPEPATAAPLPEPEPPDPTDPVHVFEAGESRVMDRADAEREGYTVVDLGDGWAPYVFSECEPDGSVCEPNAYRHVYLALANEREPPEGAHDVRGGEFLELYGIAPTPRVIRARILEDEQKDCWDEITYDALREFDRLMVFSRNVEPDAAKRRFQGMDRRARRFAEQEGLEDPMELENVPSRRGFFQRYKRIRTRYLALVEAQRRLACERLYPPRTRLREGRFDWATHEALAQFERKNRVFGWGFIGRETIEALRRTPLENHHATFLRVIEERAAAAGGYVEDGTAAEAPGAPRTFRIADGRREPLRNLLEEGRDALVEALGIETPEKLREFLVSRSEEEIAELLVAVKLPELPAYYGPDMDLHVLIQRGDVWYDFPWDEEGNEIRQPVTRRPHLTLFVRHEGQDIPLGYWGTTIGGWRSELIDGHEYYSYKNSDVGPRVWKEVIAAPVWIPPDSTPRGDLLRRVSRRGRVRRVVNYPEFGPGYASAYGLVMAPHIRETQRSDGSILDVDNGIRTHGSVDYMSIMQRHSHGCHRLYNHVAIRQFGFILRHRRYERVGKIPVNFGRRFEVDGERYEIELDTRGYSYRLETPIPVMVARGRVRGVTRDPIETPMRKPDVDYGDADAGPDAGDAGPAPAEAVAAPPPAEPPSAG